MSQAKTGGPAFGSLPEELDVALVQVETVEHFASLAEREGQVALRRQPRP